MTPARMTTEGYVLVESKVSDYSVTRVFISQTPETLDTLKGQLEEANEGYYVYAFRQAESIAVQFDEPTVGLDEPVLVDVQ